MEDRELQLFVELLPKDLRGAAAAVFTRELVERGQYVCMEGDRADFIFLVEEGTFEVVNIYGDGRVYIHGFLYPGDLFGEAYFYQEDNYPYSALAREDAHYWKARGSDFMPYVSGQPRMEEFLRVLLGQKLEQYLYKARCIAGEKVERRIACVLQRVARDRGIFDNCQARIDVALTNRDIAGLVGSTEETVSRVMSRLKREDIIGMDGKFLTVKDPIGLRSYFETL